MQPKEVIEHVDNALVEEIMQSGKRASYEDKERFEYAIMFEDGVWFRWRLTTASIKGDINISKNNYRN